LRAELTATRTRVGELEHLADTDPLLGILNRRAFVRELNRTLSMVERYGTPASLLFADLDNLKIINDKFGHGAGDAALLHAAKVIATHIRQTDVIGRLGGDEFGVILTQSDHESAKEKGRALQALVAAEEVEWGGRTLSARISCGVVEIKHGFTADEALASADSAMYDAKTKR
jgi:diguanylate cyclase (GGDEF)-like protein